MEMNTPDKEELNKDLHVEQDALAGLSAGDRVVTAGVHFLREGQKIRWTGA